MPTEGATLQTVKRVGKGKLGFSCKSLHPQLAWIGLKGARNQWLKHISVPDLDMFLPSSPPKSTGQPSSWSIQFPTINWRFICRRENFWYSSFCVCYQDQTEELQLCSVFIPCMGRGSSLQVFVQWVMCCRHTEVYSLTSRARCTISLKHQDVHRKYMQKSRLPAGNLTSCDLEPKFGIKNKHFRMHIRTLKTTALAFKVTISSWIRNEPWYPYRTCRRDNIWKTKILIR